MKEPIIKVADIAFPRFQAPDLDRMEAFLRIFGMHRSARTETALYMRGTDTDHHVHVTHLGEPNFLGLAFAATSRDDLDKLAAATGACVEASDEPGGGRVVHLRDPDGRIVDLIHGVEPVGALDLRAHPDLNTGRSRSRFGTLQRIQLGPAQVKRFGHAALKTTNLAALSDWYRSHLGFLVSDDIYIEGPDKPLGRFMRCDRGTQPTDHHTLLLLETGELKLGHAAWEVADFDDLMVGHDHLKNAGEYRHYWGIGRHTLGGQIFDYWKDPLGFTVEHWTDSDLLTADVRPGAHHVLDPLNQWGPQPPPDLDF